MKFKSFLICLIITCGLSLSPYVFAVSPSSISMSVVPPSPEPNEGVTVTVSSFAANLDTVNITWLVNGKNVLSGIGKKTLSSTAPKAGGKTTIIAKIALPDGEIDKTVTISPSVMVLLWQATNSYVSPFYKGKALLPSESEVKIVALPEIKTGGVMVNPKNMTYTWQKDYSNVGDAGGYGKNSFAFTNDYLDDTNNVSVVASTLDQNYSASGNINVTASQPQISFYKKDPSLGTDWQNAIPSTHNIVGGETLQAVPYFITPKTIQLPELNFSWFINDIAVKITNSYQKDLMPLKIPDGASGTSRLRLEIENTSKLSINAKKTIDVKF
ncbi:hypothetical protein K2P96_00840 [Patescibacteria group bacterium]|nr:hypothetical protein [Patescibacteria group bacterium]